MVRASLWAGKEVAFQEKTKVSRKKIKAERLGGMASGMLTKELSIMCLNLPKVTGTVMIGLF